MGKCVRCYLLNVFKGKGQVFSNPKLMAPSSLIVLGFFCMAGEGKKSTHSRSKDDAD